METYRAIIINPKDNVIRHTVLEPSLEKYKEIIGCDIVEHHNLLSYPSTSIWLDENAGLYPLEEQHPFMLGTEQFINTAILTGRNPHDNEHGVKDIELTINDLFNTLHYPHGEWEITK